MKEEFLNQTMGRINALIERVRCKPGDLLPSEVESALGEIKSTYAGQGLPDKWNDVVETAQVLLREAVKNPHRPDLLDTLQNRMNGYWSEVFTDAKGTESKVMKRSDFEKLNPDARMEFIKSGGEITDAPGPAESLASDKVMKRSDFEKLNPSARMEFIRSGGDVFN